MRVGKPACWAEAILRRAIAIRFHLNVQKSRGATDSLTNRMKVSALVAITSAYRYSYPTPSVWSCWRHWWCGHPASRKPYLSWVTFTILAVTGASMILQTLHLRYLGSGRLIVANFNVPFLAVCALALHVGGPSLLASLLVASTLVQSVLTLRLASLREYSHRR